MHSSDFFGVQPLLIVSFSQPITDVTSNDVICNGGINPYHTPISQVIINANAGDSITAEWHHTLAGADASDPADPIDASHKGPVMAYMYGLPWTFGDLVLNTYPGRKSRTLSNRT